MRARPRARLCARGSPSPMTPGALLLRAPAGPRKKGEGVENEEQGIVSAEAQPGGGGAVLRVTLLAAGFIIGALWHGCLAAAFQALPMSACRCCCCRCAPHTHSGPRRTAPRSSFCLPAHALQGRRDRRCGRSCA